MMRGEKELIFEAINLGRPYRIPYGELAVDKGFIEKFLGREYRSFEDEIEFSLKTGREVIKPFWFGSIWNKEERGIKKPLINLEEFEEYTASLKPIIPDAEINLIKIALKKAGEVNLAVAAQLGGVFSYSWRTVGMENFMESIYNNPEFIEVVLEKTAEFQASYARQLVEAGIEIIFLTDDLADNRGPIISPKHYRELILPKLRRIVQACGEVPVIFHSDGNTWEILPDLVAIGISGYQSIEYGVMNLRDVKKEFGNKICLFGNISCKHLASSTPEEMDRLVKEAIEIGKEGGGYIVSSDSSIAEIFPVENYLAMVEAVRKYGKD